MFCPNCGHKNADVSVFCENCGTKLSSADPADSVIAELNKTPVAETPAEPAPVVETPIAEAPVGEKPAQEYQPAYQPAYPTDNQMVYQPAYQPAYQQAYQPAYQPATKAAAPRSSHPIINAVKNVCASPLALIAVIATSVNLLLLLIFFLSGGYNALVFNVANRLLSFMFQSNGGDYYDVLDTAYGYSRYLTVYYLIALLPSIVYIAGLWITYISASRRGSDSMSTAGLLMAKIINIISLISTCVLFAVTLIVYIILIIAAVVGASSDFPGSSALAVGFSVLAVTLVFILAVFILAVIYRAKTVSSINAVRNTITTGNSGYRVSGFVAVMNFIVSVFSLFAMFFGGIIYVLAIISAITARVCFALLLFKFNAAMRRVTPKQNPPIGYANSYSQPQYPNSGYGQM